MTSISRRLDGSYLFIGEHAPLEPGRYNLPIAEDETAGVVPAEVIDDAITGPLLARIAELETKLAAAVRAVTTAASSARTARETGNLETGHVTRATAEDPIHHALHALGVSINGLTAGDGCHCNLITQVALDAAWPTAAKEQP